MKRILDYSLCLLAGVACGWYLGYVRPLKGVSRDIQVQYRHVRDTMKMTDAEMLEHGSKVTEYLDAVRESDERTAVLALEVLPRIEQGEVDQAKLYLSSNIGYFYLQHRTERHYSNLVFKIESAAAKHPIIAAEISKKSL